MARMSKQLRSFESLESRAMLAGHVNTLVDPSGNLMIFGGRASNAISVTQVSPTSWQITGFHTTINGAHSQVLIEGVTGNISIDMGGGFDNLVVHDGTINGSLSITTGGGGDRTSLANLTIRDYLHFLGGNGIDVLRATNINVIDPTDSYFSSIDTAAGADRVILDNFNDHDLATILGAGRDRLSVSNSSFNSESSSNHLIVDSGSGKDNVQLDSISAGDLNVNMGDGVGDKLSIKRSLSKSSTLHGGPGKGDKLVSVANLLGAPGSSTVDGFEKT